MRSAEIRNVTNYENCTIIEPCNLYDCELGKNVFVGPFVEIQGNVVIGANSRIQSHSFICSNTIIGHDCFIGHGVMFVNDKFKGGMRANGDNSKILRTKIGNNVLVGSGVTLLPVEICSGVTIGAGSVVTKSIDKPGIYFGNPARKYEGTL